MEADKFSKLKSYLKSKYSFDVNNISEDSSLLYDLDIKGDDVDEFLNNLIRDFHIEVKELNLSRYFIGYEPYDFMSPLIDLIKHRKINYLPTLRVSDIENFLDTGILK